MKNCDLAIVNPTGIGEAFCASILEWNSLGVPVISSLNYGTSDMMRYFKDLIIDNPDQINEKIIYYFNLNIDRKNQLKLRSFLIANYFSSKENLIIQKWLILINKSNIFINEFMDIRIYIKAIKNLLKFLMKSFKNFLKFILYIKIF